jgi:predicted nicotinamide N-methyase
MDYATLTEAHFPLRSLKLAPEIKVMSLVKSVDYPVQITNDNAPYALPYWHSQALARFILDNPALFSGRRVLDIGCGCGAASIAAAMVGAKALALDPDLRCLDFTERNATANDVEVELVWGSHKTVPSADVILAGGVFHEVHGAEIAMMAKTTPSLIAVSWQNLWDMQGFEEVAVHDMGQSRIHVFKSDLLMTGVTGTTPRGIVP